MAKVVMVPINEVINLRDKCFLELIYRHQSLMFGIDYRKYEWTTTKVKQVTKQYPRVTSTFMRHLKLLAEDLLKLAEVEYDEFDTEFNKLKASKAELHVMGIEALDKFILEGVEVTDPLKLRNLRLSISKS